MIAEDKKIAMDPRLVRFYRFCYCKEKNLFVVECKEKKSVDFNIRIYKYCDGEISLEAKMKKEIGYRENLAFSLAGIRGRYLFVVSQEYDLEGRFFCTYVYNLGTKEGKELKEIRKRTPLKVIKEFVPCSRGLLGVGVQGERPKRYGRKVDNRRVVLFKVDFTY